MSYIVLVIVFSILQALFFNHIHVFGVATPLFYVYLPLLFSRECKHWMRLLLCFVMGLTVDMFNNTPGLAAASLTLVGFIQSYLLELYLKKEDDTDFKPSVATMGFWRYLSYALALVFVHCFVFFSLEIFSLDHWLTWAESVGGSIVVTLVLILTVDSLRRS